MHSFQLCPCGHAGPAQRQRTTVTLLPLVEPCMQHACCAMGPGMICIVAQMYVQPYPSLATSSWELGRSRLEREWWARHKQLSVAFLFSSVPFDSHAHTHGSIQPTLVAVTVYFFRNSSKSQFRSSWHMRQFDFECLPFLSAYVDPIFITTPSTVVSFVLIPFSWIDRVK